MRPCSSGHKVAGERGKVVGEVDLPVLMMDSVTLCPDVVICLYISKGSIGVDSVEHHSLCLSYTKGEYSYVESIAPDHRRRSGAEFCLLERLWTSTIIRR